MPRGFSGGSLIRLRVGAEAAMSACTGPELLPPRCACLTQSWQVPLSVSGGYHALALSCLAHLLCPPAHVPAVLGAPGREYGAVTQGDSPMWGEWRMEPCPTPGTRALPEAVVWDRAEISIQSFVSGDETPTAGGSLCGLGKLGLTYRDQVRM